MKESKQMQGLAERIEFWKSCDLDEKLTAFANFINKTNQYDYENLVEAVKYFGSCLTVYIQKYNIDDIYMLHYLSECEKFLVRKVTADYEQFDQIPKAQALTVLSVKLCGFNGALAAVQDYLGKKDTLRDASENKFYCLAEKLSKKIVEQQDYNQTFLAKAAAGNCLIL